MPESKHKIATSSQLRLRDIVERLDRCSTLLVRSVLQMFATHPM